MKMTKAQQKVYDEICKEITESQECDTFAEYFEKHISPTMFDSLKTLEKYKAFNPMGYKVLNRRWQEAKNGIALTHTNSKTLYKLEEYGLIEILHDSKNDRGYAVDRVRLIKK